MYELSLPVSSTFNILTAINLAPVLSDDLIQYAHTWRRISMAATTVWHGISMYLSHRTIIVQPPPATVPATLSCTLHVQLGTQYYTRILQLLPAYSIDTATVNAVPAPGLSHCQMFAFAECPTALVTINELSIMCGNTTK